MAMVTRTSTLILLHRFCHKKYSCANWKLEYSLLWVRLFLNLSNVKAKRFSTNKKILLQKNQKPKKNPKKPCEIWHWLLTSYKQGQSSPKVHVGQLQGHDHRLKYVDTYRKALSQNYTCEISKWKSNINYIFNVKIINFMFITFSCFLNNYVSFKVVQDVTSQQLVIFTLYK